MGKRKVYVAGPWVFRPDAKQHAEELRKIAAKYGFEALIPIDSECTSATKIKYANEAMIEAADYVVADITPFRGVSADVGTAFELGFAWACRKAVFMWSADQTKYEERVTPDGMMIESFGLQDNLMLTAGYGVVVHPNIEAAMHAVREWDDMDG